MTVEPQTVSEPQVELSSSSAGHNSKHDSDS